MTKSGIPVSAPLPPFPPQSAADRALALATMCRQHRETAVEWVMEECDELAVAAVNDDARAIGDAVADAIGALALVCASLTEQERHDSLTSYYQSQLARGRALGWWVPLIEALVIHDWTYEDLEAAASVLIRRQTRMAAAAPKQPEDITAE